MKYFKYAIIVLVILSFSACKESNITESNNKNNGDINLLSTYIYGTGIQYLIPSSVGQVHAIQHAGLKIPNTSNYPSGAGITRFFNASIYKDGKRAVQLNNVTCETNPVSLQIGYLPLKYFNYWPINTGPNPGDIIDWTFDFKRVTINIDCPLPKDFGKISVSSGTEPLNKLVGGTINWGNTEPQDLILTFTYFTYDSSSSDVTDSRIVKIVKVANSGSYSITPTKLANWGVPPNATHLNVHLLKGNYVIDQYDSNTKQALTVSTVETNFMFRLN